MKSSIRTGLFFVVAAAALLPSKSVAQWNGYISASYGYDNNPLVNYQRIGDQLIQNYLQLGFASAGTNSRLDAEYNGGTVFFNRFTDRNYLDHTVRFRAAFRLGHPPARVFPVTGSEEGTESPETPDDAEDPSPPDSADSESSGPDGSEDSLRTDLPSDSLQAEMEAEGQEEDAEFDPASDSLLNILAIEAGIGARHDKQPFREFDNAGGHLFLDYAVLAADGFPLRVSNHLMFRSYPSVPELSNIANDLRGRIEWRPSPSWLFGSTLSGAVKYYTKAAYDTSKYEQSKSYVSKPGTGKLGGIVKIPSGKQVLIQPDARTTVQGVWQADAEWHSGPWSAGAAYRFRYNPASATRKVAQNSSGSVLTDDLYNDYFSYEGSEASLHLSVPLTGAVTLSLVLEAAGRKFDVPALYVSGDDTGTKRRDTAASAEIQAATQVPVGERALDISLMINISRSQSNDEYNDYSGAGISLSVGYGF